MSKILTPQTSMQTKFFKTSLLAAMLLAWSAFSSAAQSTSGLWVGEVTLSNVNETVVGIDANNNIVAPDPTVPTPVQSPAHLRIIFHVDSQGQVRLLKSVAILNKSTNSTPDLALISDPSLYPNFANVTVGQRIATAAFDFGDINAAQMLTNIAQAAGAAAAVGGDPTNAATQVMNSGDVNAAYTAFVTSAGLQKAIGAAAAAAVAPAHTVAGTNGSPAQVLAAATAAAATPNAVMTNLARANQLQTNTIIPDSRYVAAISLIVNGAAAGAASGASSNYTLTDIGFSATNGALIAWTNAIQASGPVSAGYQAFLASSAYQSSAGLAATAAAVSVSNSPASTQQKQIVATASALKALIDNQVLAAADRVVVNEQLFNGTLAAGGSLSGAIYLGASHPTNPFYHRRHPDHTIGFPITRSLSIQFDSAGGTNTLQSAGFGVDRITGTYREEITGLHKPLGPNQNVGLIATGGITLSRVSPVDTLNQ